MKIPATTSIKFPNRLKICKTCEHYQEGLCIKLSNAKGCSASKPWNICNVKCPLNLW